MKQLVMIRHGQSTWNLENRFTGWTDVDLSEKGRAEARAAGLLLRESGYDFDCAMTSMLRRAIRTLWIVLDEMDLMWIPVQSSWRLNERHYGVLQGLDKAKTAEKYGEGQVHLWRRSYTVAPAPLSRSDPGHPCHDRRYSDIPPEALPSSESLEDTLNRVLPFWHESIAPRIREGHKIILAAHGNSMRALVKYLEGISDEDIAGLNIPTGIPMIYELTDQLEVSNRFYLGNPPKESKKQSKNRREKKRRHN